MSSPKTAAKLTLFSDIRKYLVHFVQNTLQNGVSLFFLSPHFHPFSLFLFFPLSPPLHSLLLPIPNPPRTYTYTSTCSLRVNYGKNSKTTRKRLENDSKTKRMNTGCKSITKTALTVPYNLSFWGGDAVFAAHKSNFL